MRLAYVLGKALIKPHFTVFLSLGLVIGVAFLIIVLSLFQSYYHSSEKVFMGIHPHVEVYKEGMALEEADALAAQIRHGLELVVDARPALYVEVPLGLAHVDKLKALCTTKDGRVGCIKPDDFEPGMKLDTRYGYTIRTQKTRTFLVKGIQIKDDTALMDLGSVITGPTPLADLVLDLSEPGEAHSRRFYLEGGGFPRVVMSEEFLVSASPMVQNRPMILSGTLSLGPKSGKHPLMVIGIQNAQSLLGKPGEANTVEVALAKPGKAGVVASELRAMLGPQFRVTSWAEKEKAAVVFLKTIRFMIFAVVFSICVVAGVGIASILTMSALENRRHISILKALGLKDVSILWIFLVNTTLIGFAATSVGVLLGFVGCDMLIEGGREDSVGLGMHYPGVLISGFDLALVITSTMMLCWVAAVLPAVRAIKQETIDGLNQ